MAELHEAATLAVRGIRTRNDQTVVKIASDLSSFDFAQLSWTEIFRLRGSGFIQDFRAKIAEWASTYTDFRDVSAFEQRFNEFIRDAMFELIGAVEPDPATTMWAGILGNIPLPIPVNPISVLSAYSDSKKALLLKEKYGWMFFLQRARKVSSEFNAT